MMDHVQRTQSSILALANLGWLLLSREERRHLLAYVELALTSQCGGERPPQNRLSEEGTLGHIREARNASTLSKGA
jgi:hypothetical protein